MKKYKVKIKGISPLIWNRMKPELIDAYNAAKKDELEELEKKRWKQKAEIDARKNLILPSEWLQGALVNSAKFTRMVPHFATSKSQTYTKYLSTTYIEGINGKIKVGKEADLQMKSAYLSAQGARGGGKVLRCHPLLEEWEAEFIFIDGGGRMTKDEIQTLFEVAGKIIGVGDQRSQRFGRFDVETIKEV